MIVKIIHAENCKKDGYTLNKMLKCPNRVVKRLLLHKNMLLKVV